MDYKVIRDIPGHLELQNGVTDTIWPEFMFHDPVSNNNWYKLFSKFSRFQLSLVSNNEIIGIANSIPFYWDKPYEDLPEEGWDWVFKKGIEDSINGIKPNVLNGLQIAVNFNYQGKGISSLILKEMVSIARENGFKYVTIPVRPSLKSKYPLISIDNYINWQREDGLSFDPWLRVHVKYGGKIIKPCRRAMYIPGTIHEWEEWTNMKFFKSGDYVVQGALSPVKIDVSRDKGEYIEPNVWVVHEVI